MVRVSIRVRVLGLRPCIFTFHLLDGAFSQFPRGTCSLSASPPYLALDDATTLSHCTTKQHYSFPAHAPGLSPASAPHSIGSYAFAPQRPKAFHWGSFLFARRYYRNPSLFLLLSLMICLSPGRRRTHRAQLEPRPIPAAYRMLSRSSSPGEPIDPLQGITLCVVMRRASTGRRLDHNTHPVTVLPSVLCEIMCEGGENQAKKTKQRKHTYLWNRTTSTHQKTFG